ncbi:glycerol-3-phosphate 1-O-acyltransferase PlsY [Tautonia sociabilis]|uniref:Glycerol-3-phosphate acyltransferase n=1 Tax=Tautonia sociabilis TaxID=2080755 RepID=A0A432MHY0_9BACT|nr:glycerol-3-phosphate 1-O-acyltransferase PlsY [Tautonia sociabilis]RUL86735.1 glycerol-3-phosphate 1-O-acyltransferase [Tautonia sociabilis]
MTLALSVLATLLAYLIGSIPFGFLTARWAKGIDIRTVGSGNVGATNVGRVLGFKYFVLVMLLDLAKGLGPTLGFPAAVEELTGRAVPLLAVPVALAAIVGHNYPVYLRFRGGKGVATSLGAVLALDPTAAAAAAVGFLVVLAITRYVSMSSILGGTVFVAVHFSRYRGPWSASDAATASLIVVLYLMLIYRHRSNLRRIREGTESKVGAPKPRREGRVGLAVLGALGAIAATVAVGAGVTLARRPAPTLRIGGTELVEVSRVRTGYQRAESLTFADGGRVLAVACPRYNRAVLYRVDEDGRATHLRDLRLPGRPVAVRASGGRLFVLQRPHGDARHLEEGFWEAFDLQGNPVGSKFRVGWDPDDLAFSPDGRWAFVLTSGHAEGEQGKPDPALVVVSVGDRTEDHRILARLSLTVPGDDPERIVLSESARHAAIVLAGSRQIAGVDLSDPASPVETGRVPLANLEVPYMSPIGEDGGDAILMPVDSDRETVLVEDAPGVAGPLLVSTLPRGSALELVDGRERRAKGRLPLRGPLNMGSIIPTGLTYCPDLGVLAVADRSGGVRIVAFRDRQRGESVEVASSSRAHDSRPITR